MARLRNRILKADFWSDGELLRWPRDKRMTYAGLYSLAEDSGCLEDDPFNWKLLIWPSPLDADITTEKIETWRDELCDAGKLTPYFADGQQHLYINSFHEHEHPRNPQPPSLPLPEWVRWVPNRERPHRGHYEVVPVAQNRRTTRAKKALPAPTKGELVKAASSNGGTDDSFLEFWEAYPRREDKRKAEIAWKHVPKGERHLAIGVAQIMSVLYADGQREKEFIPLPTTFIHGKRWEDWREGVPAGWKDSSAERAAQQDATLDAAIAAMVAEDAG